MNIRLYGEELKANYVHMSVLILAKIVVSFYMGYVNGKRTPIILDKYANYKHEF